MTPSHYETSGVYLAGEEDAAVGGGSGHSFMRKFDFGGTHVWARPFGPNEFEPIDAARATIEIGPTLCLPAP